MSNLKSKLAQKVEILESNSSDSSNYTAHNVNEVPNNVIVLNHENKDESISIIPDFAVTINQAKERINMLQSFVKEMMVPNVDYGLIPGCQKPSLYKSGAEKLCDIFGFSKRLEITNRMEDWEKGIFAYEIKAILINKRTGLIESEGIGSCNSREKKYKNQDSFTICNTILKMAKKRALIDAVLSATRSSGIFTQDIEDMKFESTPPKNNTAITITQVYDLAKSSNIPADSIKKILRERYKVSSSSELSQSQIPDLYNYLTKVSNN